MPEGFEFYESPVDAIVHFRKIRPTSILPEERDETFEAIRRIKKNESFFVEREADSLVVYWPDKSDAEVFSPRDKDATICGQSNVLPWR